MAMPNSSRFDIKVLAKELRSGHRAALARAITLIESRRGDHQEAARELMQALLPHTGKAIRVGITGSPGVGFPPIHATESAVAPLAKPTTILVADACSAGVRAWKPSTRRPSP